MWARGVGSAGAAEFCCNLKFLLVGLAKGPEVGVRQRGNRFGRAAGACEPLDQQWWLSSRQKLSQGCLVPLRKCALGLLS